MWTQAISSTPCLGCSLGLAALSSDRGADLKYELDISEIYHPTSGGRWSSYREYWKREVGHYVGISPLRLCLRTWVVSADRAYAKLADVWVCFTALVDKTSSRGGDGVLIPGHSPAGDFSVAGNNARTFIGSGWLRRQK